MKYFVFFLLLCWCGTLYADDTPKMRIDLYGSELSASEFQTALPGAVVQEHTSDLIDSRQRDELFNSVQGLTAHLHSFDELAKDQLYIRATILSPESLFQAYPLIPQETLTELRIKVLATSRLKSGKL